MERKSNDTWQVLLLGGASGVGKTQVSYRLAAALGLGITEVDDFQVILQCMTTPEQLPRLHFWDMYPDEAQRLDEAQLLAHIQAVGRELAPALEAVIANHLTDGPSLVLEGDFILPELAARTAFAGVHADRRVRAVFIYEEDEQQILRNYHARDDKEQTRRARASWNYSQWLREEAARFGLPTVAARPWNTGLERVIEALGPQRRYETVVGRFG
jgi:2-phosphoglycerate kinase